MNVCYIDPNLKDNLGHYANTCRHILGEFRRRGFHCVALANRRIEPDLRTELEAVPFCRNEPYSPPVPFSGELSFLLARASFLSDLRRMWDRGPFDLVFINSALPAELSAIGQWLRDFGEAPPKVAVEFGAPTGEGLAARNSSAAFFAGQFRFFPRAARDLRIDDNGNLLVFTFDVSGAGSASLSQALHRPVATLPAVHIGVGAPRRRGGEGKIPTVAFMGHQRPEKGYHLIPDVVRHLRSLNLDCNLLVHNGAPDTTREDHELAAMAGNDPRLSFEHRQADQRYWQDLLDRCDLMVLPYDPERYRASYSAVACEAISDAIPVVAPAGTTMESLCRKYQQEAVTFEKWSAEDVAQAIATGLGRLDQLSVSAVEGARAWRNENGARVAVESLLERFPLFQANSTKRRRSTRAEQFMAEALDAIFFARSLARRTYYRLASIL